MHFFIAFRYLFPSIKGGKISKIPSVSAIAGFFGLFLSVATLLIVCSVFNGFKTEFIRTIIGISSHISVNSRSGQKITNYQNIRQTILNDTNCKDNIDGIHSVINGQAMISSKYYSTGIVVRGMEQNTFLHKKALQNAISQDDINKLFTKDGIWKIVLGADLARNLGVHTGDYVKLISPNVNQTLFGAIPIYKQFLVAGVFNLKMSHYDANFAFMPIDLAKRFFDYEQNQASVLEVDITSQKAINKTQACIIESLNNHQSYYVSRYDQDNASYIGAIKMQSAVINLILSLFVIVAVFIIFWVLKIIIKEKTKDIALLQTIGYTQSDIAKIFFSTGFAICVSGIICGNIFGILFSLNIDNIRLFIERTFGVIIFDSAFYFLSYLPSVVYIKDIIIINAFAIVSSIFAIYKSLKSLKNIKPSVLLK